MNGGEDGRNVIDGAPVALQDIEANAAVVVDIWMEQLGHKLDDRGFVGIVFRKNKREFESAAFPWSVVRALRET